MPAAARMPWTAYPAGTAVQIVKVRPDGSVSTTYPAKIVEAATPVGWLAVEAIWTRGPIEMDGLLFSRGDRIHEYFSDRHHFNVFAVFSPEGALRGWYANVTYPSWMGVETDMPAIYWHDLFIDVIGLPSGKVVVRDEDELEAAQVGSEDPTLVDTILAARDELLRLFQTREFPFHER